MSVSITEFKKRFGKKPVDDTKAEARYKEIFRVVGPKITAGIKLRDQKAMDALAALKLCVEKKDWYGAYDVLDEVKPDLFVDKDHANQLRSDLAIQAQRSMARNGKMAVSLKGLHDAVGAAIVIDDYQDASSQLEDFVDIVDEHQRKIAIFVKREEDLIGTGEQIELRSRAKGLESGELTKAKAEFYTQRKDLGSAIDVGDLGAAETIWKKITTLRTQLLALPEDASPAGRKKLYEERKAAAQSRLDYWLPLVGPDPLFPTHQATLGTLKTHAEAADVFYGQAKYEDALDNLDQATTLFPKLTEALKAQDTQLGQTILAFKKDVLDAIRAQKLPPVVGGFNTAEVAKANSARAVAENNRDYVLAVRKFAEMEPGFRALWAELQRQPVVPPLPQQPPQPQVPSPKIAQYQLLIANGDRKALTAALNAPDADLAIFRAQPGANKLLDDMVKAIGNKADSKEKKDFIQAAMKARFGLKEVTGGADGKGMSTKALPRLYKLFGMLPPDHTTNNELITSLERTKVNDTSMHSEGNKKVTLKAGKTGSEGSNFDDTTLHEIAHGVDAKFHFMDNNGSARKFGGWRIESKDSVKKVAAEELGFVKYFTDKGVDANLLDKYLDLLLAGGNPKTLKDQFGAAKNPALTAPDELKKHAAVKHAMAGQQAAKNDDDDKRDLTVAARKLIKDREPLKSMLSKIVEEIAYGKSDTAAIKSLLDSLAFNGQPPSDAIWEEMAVHPAADFASNVGLTGAGSSGLWDQGDAGASRYAVNGRVYQQAYSWAWVSYLLSARSAKVCNYQFRYQMEWFAECYSRFFLGTLSPNHPLVPWLTEQKNAAPKN